VFFQILKLTDVAMKTSWILSIVLAIVTSPLAAANAENPEPRSKTIASVLREPLPPEDLSCSADDGKITIKGPTFEYVVDKTTGAIVALQVKRDGSSVIELTEPANIRVGDYGLTGKENRGETTIAANSEEKIVLETKGTLKAASATAPDLPYALTSTFFNDGVVVCKLTVLPQQDLAVKDIRYEVVAKGAFRQYLHKSRSTFGFDAPFDSLPKPGESVKFSTLTSCLQVFSPTAALATFTDRGSTQVAAGLDSASITANATDGDRTAVSLVQHVVHEGAAGKGYLLKANSPFTFRVGISIAPNRLPHRRLHDLRIFAWIGDDKHPYATDEEIFNIAQMGFTVFQMHRLGNPGEPRPPAGELDRVIKTVHQSGMLFIWTANVDYQYASAPGVRDMKAKGKWPLWETIPGSVYTDPVDKYCVLDATCVGSPNGLAEYRLACDTKMMDRYRVDGMYLDDNLAYPACVHWKEHGHPQVPYDCMIELHEMNWLRRQLLRQKCPHAVLADHCSWAVFLPVICDFDVHLFGEGYDLPPLETHWARFGVIKSLNAQGGHWPGGKESERCTTSAAYNYDLLTGGGQYWYIDWRLYPQKFPYSSGVTKEEPLFVKAYNLAQYYFGRYESRSYCFDESAGLFATSAPSTYAAIYRNDVWKDYLLVLANMSADAKETSLVLQSPERLGIKPDGSYLLLDVISRKSRHLPAKELRDQGIAKVQVPGRGMKLFYLRQLPHDGPCHLWGGKRISHTWDARSGKLTFEVQGPPGLEETVLIHVGENSVSEVRVSGKQSPFFLDSAERVVHGRVAFERDPVLVEVRCPATSNRILPEKAVPSVDLPTR
jgi:hypothetical protein